MTNENVREENLNKVIGGQDANTNMPGITCPQCKKFIPTLIRLINTPSSVICPHCHLKINYDKAPIKAEQ